MKYHPPRRILVRVLTELGAGRISEGFLSDPGLRTEGWCDPRSKHIVVNPVHSTVNTVVHELLHRLYPAWGERAIRCMTSKLCNLMTDQELQTVYEEYQRRTPKLRHPRSLA